MNCVYFVITLVIGIAGLVLSYKEATEESTVEYKIYEKVYKK